MELFSEIYGLYYRITADILNHAPLSRTEIQQITAQSGFAESVLQLVPKLLDQRSWPLLDEQNGKYVSRLRHSVQMPITLLELQWLRAVLRDPRARLFLPDPEISRLEERLAQVPPLFNPSDFIYFDRSRDGDNYSSSDYVRHFRRVTAALRERLPVQITYQTGAHSAGPQILVGHYLPLKLEYSEKDDKFRVYCAQIHSGKLIRYATINLGRILEIDDSSEHCPENTCDLTGWFTHNRSQEPIIVEVFPERNAIERFLLEFSSYEKQSEFDEATGICLVKLWYAKPDETELLIRILGFGPTVRVRGPERFVRQIKTRIQMQEALLIPPHAGCASCHR